MEGNPRLGGYFKRLERDHGGADTFSAAESSCNRGILDRRLAALDPASDVLRRRAAQAEEHAAQTAPHVLDYEAELVLDGR